MQYYQTQLPESSQSGQISYLNREDWTLYQQILTRIKNNPNNLNKPHEAILKKASEVFEQTRQQRDQKRGEAASQQQKQEKPKSPPLSSRTRTKQPFEKTTHAEFYSSYGHSSTRQKQRPKLNTTDPGAQGSSDQQSPTHTFLRTFPDIPEELKEQFYNIFINFPNHLNFPINTGKRQMIL